MSMILGYYLVHSRRNRSNAVEAHLVGVMQKFRASHQKTTDSKVSQVSQNVPDEFALLVSWLAKVFHWCHFRFNFNPWKNEE